MNRYLFELLKRIEESARGLASTITFNSDQPMREVLSVKVELDEIDNALDAFKARGCSRCQRWPHRRQDDQELID